MEAKDEGFDLLLHGFRDGGFQQLGWSGTKDGVGLSKPTIFNATWYSQIALVFIGAQT